MSDHHSLLIRHRSLPSVFSFIIIMTYIFAKMVSLLPSIVPLGSNGGMTPASPIDSSCRCFPGDSCYPNVIKLSGGSSLLPCLSQLFVIMVISGLATKNHVPLSKTIGSFPKLTYLRLLLLWHGCSRTTLATHSFRIQHRALRLITLTM